GGSYAGAGLGPGAKAILASPTFTTDLPARIGFKYFDGPAGVTLKACVDSDANCQFVSSSQALAADRQWKDAYIDVPQGTHTVSRGGSQIGRSK
uniref:Uncharacterized protein n=1 Tax=Romanomermis culicivorax TaxID=13658 RepID=A0A915IG49_ROMCU